MKIISLSTLDRCGIASYNNALQAAFRRLGHSYDVEPITDDIRSGDEKALLRFVRRIADFDAVVIQHEFSFFGVGQRASMRQFAWLMKRARSYGKPTIVFLHTPSFCGRRRWAFTSRTARTTNTFVCALNRGDNTTVFVHGDHAVRRLKADGIEIKRIRPIAFPNPPAKPALAPRRGGTVTLGIFGFISEYKGYECLLQAMVLLPDNFNLIIAGDHHPRGWNDPTLNKIYRFLQTGNWHEATLPPISVDADELASLRKRVLITGYISPSDIDDIFQRIDIVVAPYTVRGPAGSGALSESLARGKPIIASAAPCFQEIHDTGSCLRLVATQAPYELATAVEQLAADPDEQARLSRAARAFAAAHSYDALARECLEVFSGARGNRWRSRGSLPQSKPLTAVEGVAGA